MDHRETTSISIEEAEKNFGHYRDAALNGPVLIAQEGRPTTVLISYEEFVRLKRRDRQAYDLDDLPDHLVTAIFEAELPDELEDEPEPASVRA